MLRGLEAEVICAGVVGNDAAGRALRESLEAAGIDTAGVVYDPTRPTTEKERFIGRAANRHGHQILRVDTEERAAVHEAGQHAVVHVSPLVAEGTLGVLPPGVRKVEAHWHLTPEALEGLRAALALDLAVRESPS